MAENVTVARPYAEAAFQLAKEASALGAWSQALDRMSAVIDDPQMGECIGNPVISADVLKQLFLDVVGGNLTVDQQSFVGVLVENKRLGIVPEIRDLFTQLKNKAEATQDATIQSAFEIDNVALAQLIAELETRFKCKVRATVSIDPELIGGVRIAVGDQVIDASVRGKLASMAAAVQN